MRWISFTIFKIPRGSGVPLLPFVVEVCWRCWCCSRVRLLVRVLRVLLLLVLAPLWKRAALRSAIVIARRLHVRGRFAGRAIRGGAVDTLAVDTPAVATPTVVTPDVVTLAVATPAVDTPTTPVQELLIILRLDPALALQSPPLPLAPLEQAFKHGFWRFFGGAAADSLSSSSSSALP
jgi:hypothetical protein